jgi:hypothetical protein
VLNTYRLVPFHLSLNNADHNQGFHTVYILLGYISHPEVISDTWEHVHGLYANPVPFSRRDLSNRGFSHPGVTLESVPCGYLGDNCICPSRKFCELNTRFHNAVLDACSPHMAIVGPPHVSLRAGMWSLGVTCRLARTWLASPTHSFPWVGLGGARRSAEFPGVAAAGLELSLRPVVRGPTASRGGC